MIQKWLKMTKNIFWFFQGLAQQESHKGKALHGLRDASLAGLQLLTMTVEDVGLWSDSLEPCVYGGQIMRDGHDLGFWLAVVYVDDVLLLSTTQEAENHVVDVLSSVVPVKTTGVIGDEGGSLIFIGRVIKREKALGVDPHYLDTAFVAYRITRGSDHVPDLRMGTLLKNHC